MGLLGLTNSVSQQSLPRVVLAWPHIPSPSPRMLAICKTGGSSRVQNLGPDSKFYEGILIEREIESMAEINLIIL